MNLLKKVAFLSKERAMRGAGSVSSASWQSFCGGERGVGVFCAVSQSQSKSHRYSTSHSEFPAWHYFVCNLITLKGVGLRLACIAKE